MGFSSFKAERLVSILARSERYDAEYRRKARVAFERLNPGQRLLPQFDGLVGASTGEVNMREATAADDRARTALRKRLVGLVRHLHRRNPQYAFYFGTVIRADWHTDSHATLINLVDMQDRMRNVMRMCGFKGAVMMLEIQAARLLGEGPYSGKKRHRRTARFERTIQDMHPDICLRLTEVLGHLLLSELLLLTGEATALRKELLAPLPAASTGTNRAYEESPVLAAKFWDRARARGSTYYTPVVIDRKPHPKKR